MAARSDPLPPARRHASPLPYRYDETQGIAHAGGAVSTPDLFDCNARLEPQYRGRREAAH